MRATIQGRVVNPQGRPVAEAAVYIISAPVNMPDIAQLTGDQGQFTIAAPASGRYILGVRSDSWGIVQSDVEVGGTEMATVKIQPGLA